MATDAGPRTFTVGDGGDFRSIGAAVSAATAGSRIRVRAGTYAEALILDRDVEIVADPEATLEGPAGGTVTVLGGSVRIDGLAIRSRPAGLGRRLLGRLGKGEQVSVVLVSGGSLEMARCDISGVEETLVFVLDTGRCTLVECRIHDGREGGVFVCGVDAASQAHLERCELSGFGGEAITVARGGTAFVSGGSLSGARTGLSVGAGGRAELHGVRVTDCRGGANALEEGAVLVVSQGQINDCADEGLAVSGGGRAEIRDTDIRRTSRGISVDGAGSSAIAFDARVREGDVGISVADGAHAEIEGCRVERSGRVGILVADRETVAGIRRCVVSGSGGYGVALFDDALVALEESEITDNLFAGVKVDGSGTRATISGNTIARNGGVSGGIVTGNARPTTRGNRIAALMAWRGVECDAPDSAGDSLEPPDLAPRGAPGDTPRPAVGAKIGLGTVPTSLVLDAANAPWVAVPDLGVCRVDPASCRIDRVVEIRPPGAPGLLGLVFDLAHAGDDLWAAYASFDTNGDRQAGGGLARIDPAEGRVTRWIPLDGTPGVICIADGHAWVATSEPGAILRVSLAPDGVATKVLDLREPGPIVAGNGCIWAADRGAGVIHALGTRHGENPSRIGAKDVNGLALTPAGLVAAAPRGGNDPSDKRHAILRIDDAAGRVVGERTGLGATYAVGFGAAGLWAAPTGRVAELDPVTLEIRREVEVGTIAQRLVVGREHVWVLYAYSVGFLSTESVPGTLVRIDL